MDILNTPFDPHDFYIQYNMMRRKSERDIECDEKCDKIEYDQIR